jgi:2-dehydro-3-deoxy-D-arabinonate dehydratase
MTLGLYRLALPDGSARLARGDPEAGPAELLPVDMSIDAVLGGAASSFAEALLEAPPAGPIPPGAALLPPVESQEVWAAGVTYLRSREARAEESTEDPDVYARVYAAERPELFFNSAGWRVRGPGQPIGVRQDSSWDVPEPELALVLAADLGIAGATIGNDVSSRSIEGQNPLYLPQAKVYEGSCALGPAIVPATGGTLANLRIQMDVVRAGSTLFSGEASTGQMKRSFEDLTGHLGRALRFPVGVVLLTGTAIVPEPTFTLRPGDLVRIGIDGLGVLENPVEEVGARHSNADRTRGR